MDWTGEWLVLQVEAESGRRQENYEVNQNGKAVAAGYKEQTKNEKWSKSN